MKFILDTNIALDWLVFNDPATHALQSAVVSGRATVVTHAVALDELTRVLAYPALKLDAQRQTKLLAEYQQRCTMLTMPDGFARDRLLLPAGFPQCRDPDDQPFIALAFHLRIPLVSRDKAVLKLRKKLVRFGVAILDADAMNQAVRS